MQDSQVPVTTFDEFYVLIKNIFICLDGDGENLKSFLENGFFEYISGMKEKVEVKKLMEDIFNILLKLRIADKELDEKTFNKKLIKASKSNSPENVDSSLSQSRIPVNISGNSDCTINASCSSIDDATLKRENEHLDKELRSCQELLSTNASKIKSLKDQNLTLSSENRKLSTHNEKLSKKNDKLRLKVNSCNEQKEISTKSTRSLDLPSPRDNPMVSTHYKELKRINEEIKQQYESKIKELTEQVKNLNSTVLERDKSMKELQNKIAEDRSVFESEFQCKLADFNLVVEEKKKLLEDNTRLRADNEKWLEKIKELETEISELQNTIGHFDSIESTLI